MKYFASILLSLCLFPLISFASVVSAVPLACGYSDFIFERIPEWTQEKAQLNFPFNGSQGETGRRFLMYSDHSWVLTFEFFSKVDPKYDVSCIVRTGLEPEAYDATTSKIESLPSMRMGPTLHAEDESRLVISE